MNSPRPIPVSGPEIVRLAIEWYNEPTYEHVAALFAALATRPECYSPPRPAGGGRASDDHGSVDAVKTCPDASSPAGYLWPEPSLRDIAKGTTGFGDDD